ncbi:chemotaxis protein CheW [Photobacterium sp.]|uniref:chemotaxis protein CheW n=1 Tax=Photobacterium sp. TaxID=660 RepID=UPI00299E1A74|nr:chemotaxis protein CheW [Photobacterium sp.]MDX1302332.1 chemotaxis protein CheW [Photobacterium sp.]
MNDKNRLSSEQALDDYFFDLLAEPSLFDEGAAAEQKTAVIEESAGVLSSAPAIEQDCDHCGNLSEDSALAKGHHPAEQQDSQDLQSAEADNGCGPTATPFDFDQLSGEIANLSDGLEARSGSADALSEAGVGFGAIVSEGAGPTRGSQASGWVLQAEPVAKLQPKSSDRSPATAVFDNERSELQGVQRLLSQMSRMQQEIQLESDGLIATQTEAEFLAVAETDSVALQPAITEPDIEPVVPEESQIDFEPGVSTLRQVKEGGDEPPEQWRKLGSEQAFQALFFEVNGVTFAVALNELGGIHQMGELNHLLGRPAWYLGLLTNREKQFDVVDTACWVMPEKLGTDEYQENYRYIVMLGESKWGLACDKLHGTETLTEQSVRWREKAGKRPWLAGMVKEKMCALIHVNALISMLNEGLDVKGIM